MGALWASLKIVYYLFLKSIVSLVFPYVSKYIQKYCCPDTAAKGLHGHLSKLYISSLLIFQNLFTYVPFHEWVFAFGSHQIFLIPPFLWLLSKLFSFPFEILSFPFKTFFSWDKWRPPEEAKKPLGKRLRQTERLRIEPLVLFLWGLKWSRLSHSCLWWH